MLVYSVLDVLMDFNQAIKVINQLMINQKGRRLTEGGLVAVKAAWDDLPYEEAISLQKADVSAGYISSRLGPDIWRFLSEVLKTRITKKSLRPVFEELAEKGAIDLAVVKTTTPQVRMVSSNGFRKYPSTECFYGYEAELQQLIEHVNNQQCVIITGAPGVGKSTIAARLLEIINYQSDQVFENIVWKTIHPNLSFAEALKDWSKELEISKPSASVLLDYLAVHRCLFVLDGVQELLKIKLNSEQLYEEYIVFLSRCIQEQERSSIIVTSHDKLPDLFELREQSNPICFMHLNGIGQSAKYILKDKGLTDEETWPDLIDKYRGNPLALKVISNRIKKFFNGHVATFLEYQSTWIGDPFIEILNEIFELDIPFSRLQKQIISFLANTLADRPSISLVEIFEGVIKNHKYTDSKTEVLEVLNMLIDRSLIEKEKEVEDMSYFCLSPMVRKYVLTDPKGLMKSAFE